MLILLDVDGVVADFGDHLLQQVAPRLTLQDVKKFDVFDYLTESERALTHDVLRTDEFWLSQPVLPGASEGVDLLRTKWDILWVTTPWYSHRTQTACRKEWLKKHFGASHKDIIFAASKQHVRGDVFIDDKVSNVEAWREQYPEGLSLLFDQPYNANAEGFRRFTWSTERPLERGPWRTPLDLLRE